MAKMGEFFKSNYFSADSLLNGDVTLTISHCEPVVFESRDKSKGDEQKMVVYFHEDERGLALNVTNWNSIGEIVGDEDTDTWPGHQVTLTRKKDKGIGGQLVWCVRVKAPQAQAQPQQRPPQPQRAAATAAPQQRKGPQATERQYPEAPAQIDEDDVPFVWIGALFAASALLTHALSIGVLG